MARRLFFAGLPIDAHSFGTDIHKLARLFLYCCLHPIKGGDYTLSG